MSRFLLWVLCFHCCLLYAQFSDDFSDHNFSLNPTWLGDTSHFSASSQNLQLNAPSVSDTSFLYTNSDVSINAEWTFDVSLDFNPSSSNFCSVYLMADKENISLSKQAYYVKIGGSSDEISLYRQDESSSVKIIDGLNQRTNLSNGMYKIKVVRDSLFNWTLYSDTGSSHSYQLEGSASDSAYKTSKFFGIVCKYTSTRSDKFSFDNFNVFGQKYEDKNEPVITTHSIANSNVWKLFFNEAIKFEELKTSYFKTNENQKVKTIHYDSSSFELNLVFDKDFDHGRLSTLIIDSIEDKAGNYIEKTFLTDVYSNVDSIKYKSLIFTEIMADPETPVSLPNIEYIEIYNRSDDYIRMSNFYIIDSKDTLKLPEVLINPDEYFLLIDKDDSANWQLGSQKILYLESLSLSNAGEELSLITSKFYTIDSLNYVPTLMEPDKRDGGWSIELININFICSSEGNWTSSIDPSGGTPGKINSVYDTLRDNDNLNIEKVSHLNDTSVYLKLSQPFEKSKIDQLSVDFVPSCDIKEIVKSDKELQISLSNSFVENQLYLVSVNHLNNCYGEIEPEIGFEFAIPSEVEERDLIINELLFNPFSGEKEFIELYNRSDKYIDLQDIGLYKVENQLPADSHMLRSERFIIWPGEYVAFTDDSLSVIGSYKCSDTSFIHNSNIPSFSDKNGHIVLYSTSGIILDQLKYNEEMHFAGLEDVKGVSLERISSESSSDNESNWTSASSSCGFGSPGKINSQNTSFNSAGFSIIPDIFSPDNDGYHDVCEINIDVGQEGSLASISIYNDQGYFIRSLANSNFLGSVESFYWDGTDRFSEKVPIGYYLIELNLVTKQGVNEKYKGTVVVTTRQ